jgi:hypothetical protein
MKWVRLLFAILMGFGAVTNFLAGRMSMCIFFVICCALTVWSMSWGGGKDGKKA